MAAFSYQAVDRSGQRQRGVIEAGTAAGARRALRERALLPLSVVASHPSATASATANGPAGLFDKLRDRSISSQALSTATRQLATLIGSNVSIEEALQLAAEQASTPALKAVLLDVRGTVIEGSTFAQGLARHPKVFPEYYRASIDAGEKSGRLPEVLSYLAGFVQARHRASQKVKLALIYPGLLAVISALMITLMMIYVVPDIVRVFLTRGADLPLLTKLLIAFSNLINNYGLALVAGFAVMGLLARRELARPARRLAVDRILATRRPFARFSRQANAARFTATLATLVQSKVPLLDALISAAAVVPNRHIRAQAEIVAMRVREGDSMHRAMAAVDVFPGMLVAIIASGELGGHLGQALGRAAAELDHEIEAQVAVLVALVEPAVLLAMGGLVLLMVLAILLPIIGLNDLAIT